MWPNHPPLTSFSLDKEYYEIRHDEDNQDISVRLPDLAKISAGMGDVDTHMQICEVFLPDVVGVAKWKANYCNVGLSKFVTTSDLALVILLLENFYERWKDYLTSKQISKTILTRYTSKKTSGSNEMDDLPRKAANSKWSTEGLHRYNDIIRLMKKQRRSPTGAQFDSTFLSVMRSKHCSHKENKTSKRKRKEREEVEIEIDTDVFAV